MTGLFNQEIYLVLNQFIRSTFQKIAIEYSAVVKGCGVVERSTTLLVLRLCGQWELLGYEFDELGLVEEDRLVEGRGPVLVPGQGQPLGGHQLLDNGNNPSRGGIVQDTDGVLGNERFKSKINVCLNSLLDLKAMR